MLFLNLLLTFALVSTSAATSQVPIASGSSGPSQPDSEFDIRCFYWLPPSVFVSHVFQSDELQNVDIYPNRVPKDKILRPFIQSSLLEGCRMSSSSPRVLSLSQNCGNISLWKTSIRKMLKDTFPGAHRSLVGLFFSRDREISYQQFFSIEWKKI
jgi:hypothetical protein